MTTVRSVRPEEAEAFGRLVRTVARATRFALAFAVFDAPTQRDRLIRALSERLRPGRNVLTVDVGKTTARGQDRGLLEGLNRDRERFPRLVDVPLVLWLTEPGLTLIAREAPDFWAWRSGVFTFPLKARVPAARGTAGRRDGLPALDEERLADRDQVGGSPGTPVMPRVDHEPATPGLAVQLWREITGQEPTEPIATRFGAYLSDLVDRHRFLDFRGMGVADRVPLRIPLLEMYVPLSARASLPAGETWVRSLAVAGRRAAPEEVEAIGERVGEARPVTELLERWDAVVILGDPGSGKTTLLRYLALMCALGRGGEVGLGARLPVLVPVAAYANALKDRDVGVLDFVAREADRRAGGGDTRSLVDQALDAGGGLLLLDGLDEVRNRALRQRIVDRIGTLIAAYRGSGNKLLLTSRIVGYREVRPADEGLAECTLLDFGDEDVEEFVTRWTAAVERAARGETPVATEEARRERGELLAAIRAHPGVRALATNPLLLTILALMKRQGVVLPDRRVELYQQYVEILLRHWNLARSLGRRDAPHLDVAGTMNVLALLALWMHETSPGVGLVDGGAMRHQVEEIYRRRGGLDAGGAAARFLEDVRDHAGLLVERGPGQYGFIHLTFQEYLAAVGVALLGQQSVDPIVEQLAGRAREETWREVILLTVGVLGIVQRREEAASAVVEQLVRRAPGEAGRAVLLAAEAVADAAPGGVSEACRAGIVRAAVETLRDDARVAVRVRVGAGNALARLGDPRFRADVWFLPDEPLLGFVEIPGGAFRMGSDRQQDDMAFPDEMPARDVSLPTCFIARYPVTVAQFAAYTADTGTPHRPEGSRRATANHPVVGVSWHEALAYSAWLTLKLRDWSGTPEPLARLLREGTVAGLPWRITLPSEAEWEKAARGLDGRRFPWGDAPEPWRANYRDTGIGTTSPVGCFPSGASPFGVEESSGNVWEWTRSAWKPYPYDPADGRERFDMGAALLRHPVFADLVRSYAARHP
jgi:formylglycine-generating enzyme required for sulfatase activity